MLTFFVSGWACSHKKHQQPVWSEHGARLGAMREAAAVAAGGYLDALALPLAQCTTNSLRRIAQRA